MDCIVSVHYRDSDFELDQCDIHRRKRQAAGDNEKELEYKIELVVKDSKNQPGDQNSSAVKYSIFGFIFIFIFQYFNYFLFIYNLLINYLQKTFLFY